ncbi:hypothetical protein MRQ36_29205 [Micromonospora sp. R77]|uniref:hypothetical protein n=1 Tax=Micromonospora sp. R77 TaxID=2925836 RepID=UPI001F6235C5|nr:hypothetical protein [Micromonospora sp. R77]MCI4066414.1 hypothetical protein [Micromonospora sp. R77]
MIRKLATTAAVLATSAVAAVTVMAPPASASTAGAEWYGTVHVTLNTSTSYGGWIDGNGPDSYRFWIQCSNGSEYRGVTRWAGDRRGSFAYCPSGTSGVSRGWDLLPA